MIEIPIARGWSMTAGADLMLSRGHLDPAPPGGEPRGAFTGMLTLGLAATLSTDKRRLFPRDPGAEEDEAQRRDGAQMAPGVREIDRTRIDAGRADEGGS